VDLVRLSGGYGAVRAEVDQAGDVPHPSVDQQVHGVAEAHHARAGPVAPGAADGEALLRHMPRADPSAGNGSTLLAGEVTDPAGAQRGDDIGLVLAHEAGQAQWPAGGGVGRAVGGVHRPCVGSLAELAGLPEERGGRVGAPLAEPAAVPPQVVDPGKHAERQEEPDPAPPRCAPTAFRPLGAVCPALLRGLGHGPSHTVGGRGVPGSGWPRTRRRPSHSSTAGRGPGDVRRAGSGGDDLPLLPRL
jgi:hypothetical protein